MNEFFKGLGYYKKAVRFSSDQGLWGYYVVPALLNIVLLLGMLWLAWVYTQDLSQFLIEWFGIGEAEGGWQVALEYTVLILVRLLTALVFVKAYKYIMLLLLSPLLSYLGGIVQERLHGEEQVFSWAQLWKDTLRGIGVASRSFLWEISLLVLLTALSFVPIMAPFTFVGLLLVEWYFIGLSMADCRHEYKQLSPKESMRVSKRHKGLLFGIGCGMYLMMFVPVVGVIMAPMLAVVAAGIAFYEAEDMGRTA